MEVIFKNELNDDSVIRVKKAINVFGDIAKRIDKECEFTLDVARHGIYTEVLCRVNKNIVLNLETMKMTLFKLEVKQYEDGTVTRLWLIHKTEMCYIELAITAPPQILVSIALSE